MKRAKSINSNVFFVPGNHEDRNPLYPKLSLKIRSLGITILNNRSTTIGINQEQVNISGVEFQVSQEEYNKVLKDINSDNFTILLSHTPNKPMEYLTGEEDLILSGHTHGGQVRLPLIGPVIAPGQGLFPKFDKGILMLKNATLYIDSGLGNRLLPVRLFNRVQISNIMVESSK